MMEMKAKEAEKVKVIEVKEAVLKTKPNKLALSRVNSKKKEGANKADKNKVDADKAEASKVTKIKIEEKF